MNTHSMCGLLDAQDPWGDDAFIEIAGELGQVNLEDVLSGDRDAVRFYITSWRSARTKLLDLVTTQCPQLELPPVTAELLDREALQAPFSAAVRNMAERWHAAMSEAEVLGWHTQRPDLLVTHQPSFILPEVKLIEAYVPRVLTARLVDRLRELAARPAAELLWVPGDLAVHTSFRVEPRYEPEHLLRFLREADAALHGRVNTAAQIAEAYDLNATELGNLFGVSRQAAARWLADDLPSERKAKGATVLAIADILTHRLKVGRLPGVARRSAAAYGGLNMLQMIALDRHEQLLESVRESFRFERTA